MGIDRRNFFKVLGVTGATLALGKEVAAAEQEEEVNDAYGILYDVFMCGGCQTCEFTCAELHNLPAPEDVPEIGISRKTNDQRRTVVNAYDTSGGEVAVKRQCMHCLEPACVSACLTQAMYKTKEGPVIWREEKCMGCRYCMVSCPFDMPKFEYNSPNPKIIKCDMCYDRIKEGKEPACVEICPAGALVFGKRSELIKEARKRIMEMPEWYTDHIYGELEAGGTGFMYNAPVPFSEMDFNTKLQKRSYPELTKGFLYSVPTIFILWPTILLGIHEATKNKNNNQNKIQDDHA
ncbi:MAG: 4Fe-4S dicluster domain-containing protein [Bacteroidales bacterium]|nr:4Fe-4S dicluster domain-containing protein [Bacteroidales bacterium]MCF8343408.1 4Fe-4S dicluster domain-containing protein [Bacteroidales bacterium]MCF8349848.1 4Fe-4S dicluster domain-containing protein [Bacteroidales bacterium]MCF8375556.1 4Fe-4S dicluster domain-containing protein [Bacteroidales bacterium]MCF8399955.1 4Fe-4S dicluster domain-containing protein [Bacteroidales bacterium]